MTVRTATTVSGNRSGTNYSTDHDSFGTSRASSAASPRARRIPRDSTREGYKSAQRCERTVQARARRAMVDRAFLLLSGVGLVGQPHRSGATRAALGNRDPAAGGVAVRVETRSGAAVLKALGTATVAQVYAFRSEHGQDRCRFGGCDDASRTGCEPRRKSPVIRSRSSQGPIARQRRGSRRQSPARSGESSVGPTCCPVPHP